ncbi:retropepsin-like aspartic protease [Cronbergia sp. UHCC 0137]|uniref:retropepsin-like aspartic protease family protein n=1 Tax=Cronbergia sp. UHCC 0137 TaxID=3110239 RepID=UPI002B204CE8|nr:retropepsin-like aspartic protease [Cronbergia sp. UHCC 0137]MEA5619813.1 retropepsin-like aspartic protease [Cronbergia sp. UHCC 0137]
MLESFLSRTALIFLSCGLAVVSVACNGDKQTRVTGSQRSIDSLAAISPPRKPAPPLVSPEPQPKATLDSQPNAFELALDKAAGALSISQSAQSVDDWNLVASQFQDAIALMKKVRRDSPNFPFAQSKIAEYRLQIKSAQQQINPVKKPVKVASPVTQRQSIVIAVPKPLTTTKAAPIKKVQPISPPPPVAPLSASFTPNNKVFIAPIKRRLSGTPVIDVIFNGNQRFEMIVDTGASGTVITQKIAEALGVVPVGKAKANTVNSKAVEFDVGYVDSMAVDGMTVNKIPVAIAGVELETGLLGHDFFGDYDVTIKRNVIEFRPQNHSENNY